MKTSADRKPVVVSVEQALSMPYATLRFVHLGWRVIRIEPTPLPGRKSKGDPNRYIGTPVAGEDRHSYYVAPNVGKEALALNLKTPEGQEVLHRLLDELEVDVFCTNTMPGRHAGLGIDYETLSKGREGLIWAAISAMGTAHPDVPGYDPAMQALCGYMDLTGAPDGPPLQCGPPLIDLKAGDEVFAQVLLGLLDRAQGGRGRKIDVSMAHAAVSWLQTFLPMLEMGSDPADIRRSGNEHRQFIPVNSYATNDGFIYMALGSDAQWIRLVAERMFATLDQERFMTNEGRRADKKELHALIGGITARHSKADVSAVFERAAIPHSPISLIEEVGKLPFVRDTALHTTTPDGRRIILPPPALPTEWLNEHGGEIPFAPAYGADNDSVLQEIGYSGTRISELRAEGVLA
jgi:phenylsuccinyl-CoA transferase